MPARVLKIRGGHSRIRHVVECIRSNPATGTLPGGFSFGSGLPAFQISTNANYTAPITICIAVPGVSDPAILNTLRLFHYESGVLVDRTVIRDFLTRTICAQTTSLSPFAVAEDLAPTAANVSISGRVMTANGSGLRNAIVVLTDRSGTIRTARTGSFGYYRFEGIEAGQTVILSVRSKLCQFAPQVVSVSEDIADLDFSPIGEAEF